MRRANMKVCGVLIALCLLSGLLFAATANYDIYEKDPRYVNGVLTYSMVVSGVSGAVLWLNGSIAGMDNTLKVKGLQEKKTYIIAIIEVKQ